MERNLRENLLRWALSAFVTLWANINYNMDDKATNAV
jgi:hypothetical protein